MYMMTFYALPASYTWGNALTATGIRWNLVAAFIFACAVVLDSRRTTIGHRLDIHRIVIAAIGLFSINAAFVHLLAADNPERSAANLELLWKRFGLLVVMVAALKDRKDFKILFMTILIGGMYVGYEAIFNNVGSDHDGRLWLKIGGTAGNHVTPILCLSLPIGAYFLVHGKWKEKGVALLSIVLTGETVLRCISRASFVGVLIAAGWFVIRSKGKHRILAIVGVLVGLPVAFVQMEEGGLERFMTTFAASGERDGSAQSRVDFLKAGIEMFKDHPFGTGGESCFESDLGATYIRHLGREAMIVRDGGYRSVHNGFITIAAGWGIQGFLLLSSAVVVSWRRLHAVQQLSHDPQMQDPVLASVALECMIVILLTCSMFNSDYGGEAYYWWMAMVLGIDKVASQQPSMAIQQPGTELA